jgi:hypothetical protein
MAGPEPRTRNRSNAAQTAGEDSNLHSVEIVTEPVNADYDTQLKQPSPEIPITNIFSPHSSDAGTQPTPTKQSSSTQQCSWDTHRLTTRSNHRSNTIDKQDPD